MRRSLWLGACLLLGACGGREPEVAAESPEVAAQRALRFLFARQAPDGAFRSEVHGVLQPGHSLCATVLLCAALLPARLRAPHRDGIDRALRFLARATDTDGAIGLGGPGLDYPIWSSAHYLHALCLLQPEGWQALAQAQVGRLRAIQLGPDQGWEPADAMYGGFGSGSGIEPKPLGAGLVDLSSTTAALEALAAAGVGHDDPVLVRARAFVARCQRMPSADDPHGDGGFFFTPEPAWRSSKAGLRRDQDGVERPVSYGTTTCDGIRALRAWGAGPEEPRLLAAQKWLRQRVEFAHVPGLPQDDRPPTEPALRFYWWATLARTLHALHWPGDWREGLFREIARHQRPDGGFAGFSDRMKEDDPLVATCLALLALGPLVPD